MDPYEEGNAINSVDGSRMRTELEKGPAVRSLVETLSYCFRLREKTVRVLPLPMLVPLRESSDKEKAPSPKADEARKATVVNASIGYESLVLKSIRLDPTG